MLDDAGRWDVRILAVAALVLLGAVRSAPAAEPALPGNNETAGLHVPSPDWRDQVLYFVMLDRFDDGDPGNNDQGAGEYDPSDGARFSGGDLAGLTRRLDYIGGLGVTGIWITPPVANQWWNPATSYGGYHGYWATDFKAVDAHFGTLDDYRALSRALHGAGMVLVQDVVVNHTANYFAYPGGRVTDAAGEVRMIRDSAGLSAPTQRPFSMNDPRIPAHREAGIYHWTPDIVDYSDRNQELTWQLAGLDDLATGNAWVRRALRDAYGYWIREVGVDAFRVDTAFYVEPEYFTDFLHSDDPQAPGIAKVAAVTGRADFHVFGEGFAFDKAFDDAMARKIDRYMHDEDGTPRLPGMINFPMHGTMGDVFARGHPPAELAYRIRSTMQLHQRPHLMPTFIDNHDVDRFLGTGSEPALRQALLAMLTLPGIPVIYYGTEQGFRDPRASMFAGGVGSGGRDHFDTEAPLYRYLQAAIALRRDHCLFSRGVPTVLAANAAAPGALAYRVDHEGTSALVVFNTSGGATLLDNLDSGFPPGTVLRPLFAIEGSAPEAMVGADGRIDLALPPGAGYVWRAAGAREAEENAAAGAITLQPMAEEGNRAPLSPRVRGDFDVGGTASDVARMQVVVDGDLATAQWVTVQPDGRWRTRIDTRDMVDPALTHSVVAWSPEAGIASNRHVFKVAREWTLLRDIDDPAGDDHGPSGRYEYPDDEGWRTHRQGDLQRVRVWGSGGALKVELKMREVTALWTPAQGFDHVAFTMFVQLPGRGDGAVVMPQQHAVLPDAMRWNVRLRAHGWSNALFGSDGASDGIEGTPIAASARIVVDRQANTVTFTIPARALGNVGSLAGARLYINTWDYDGGYRSLTPQAQPAGFGGGDGASDPLILDDTGVIELHSPQGSL
ncbi:MAG: alpha-amylase family glycosyl hydrolase [Pseudomonadota bacterium]|nr:alpha-amylase family glycosyl hydrolase [Pseudomonadota bacterium]